MPSTRSTATAVTAGRRPYRPAPQRADEQHAEWLGLLGPDGPFLTVPVLTAALPDGLDTVPDEVRQRIRQGWGEILDAPPDLLAPAWVELILTELLRYPASARGDGTALPSEILAGADRRRRRPDWIMYGPEPGGGRAARLHVYHLPADTPLTRPDGDRPAPTEQAAQLCRDTRTPVALLTNGQHWALVHARHRSRRLRRRPVVGGAAAAAGVRHPAGGEPGAAAGRQPGRHRVDQPRRVVRPQRRRPHPGHHHPR
ncbi:hypothetical protein [Micromonospora sp. LOL_023]|uniref:hypothetical protein n=1 Tax=Micromonospora sp. LOL_023 TaxID=3345418 RepID=UPI003A842C32